MTEQFSLDQRLGHRRAIQRDKRPVPPQAETVKSLCDQLLAGSAFTDYKYRTVQWCRPAGFFHGIEESPRFPDKLTLSLHDQDIVPIPIK